MRLLTAGSLVRVQQGEPKSTGYLSVDFFFFEILISLVASNGQSGIKQAVFAVFPGDVPLQFYSNFFNNFRKIPLTSGPNDAIISKR